MKSALTWQEVSTLLSFTQMTADPLNIPCYKNIDIKLYGSVSCETRVKSHFVLHFPCACSEFHNAKSNYLQIVV